MISKTYDYMRFYLRLFSHLGGRIIGSKNMNQSILSLLQWEADWLNTDISSTAKI